MRLDKYLKVSRLVKRRTLAKELVDLGRVSINERVAKPSSDVKVNDVLKIHLRDRFLYVEILNVCENVKANEADSMYKIIKEEIIK